MTSICFSQWSTTHSTVCSGVASGSAVSALRLDPPAPRPPQPHTHGIILHSFTEFHVSPEVHAHSRATMGPWQRHAAVAHILSIRAIVRSGACTRRSGVPPYFRAAAWSLPTALYSSPPPPPAGSHSPESMQRFMWYCASSVDRVARAFLSDSTSRSPNCTRRAGSRVRQSGKHGERAGRSCVGASAETRGGGSLRCGAPYRRLQNLGQSLKDFRRV